MQVTVRDIGYVRFSAPDLGAMRSFLGDFGMAVASQSSSLLCMRGSGDAPFVHVTEVGEPRYRGFGFMVEDVGELRGLAQREGVAVQSVTDAPGGGEFIRLRDPDGFEVDVVAGQANCASRTVTALQAWNTSASFARGPVARRVAAAPSTVVRLGHVVHTVADLERTWDWYSERFRLIISDDVVTPERKRVALFIRLDRGAEPVDHHILNFGELPDRRSGFHHAAYEVRDFDDLMVGSEYLAARRYKHRWGVGRHILGSQVFDYWSDPWGHVVEHWTDGDRFDADEPSHSADVETMVGLQWGPAPPLDMIS